MERWIGKTAVVTGASAGIGAAICVALASADINVVGLARRPALIDVSSYLHPELTKFYARHMELHSKVSGNGVIKSLKCDVSVPEQVAASFKWISENVGCIHIIVNNAGVFIKGHITDASGHMVTEEDLLATIDTNFKGPVMCTRHAVHSMRTHGVEGHIININSISGHYVPFTSTFNLYPSTKHALTAFTAGLLNEIAEHKNRIKVTSLSPGLVNTSMAYGHEDMPSLRAEDVADTLLYVLSTPPSVNINEITITAVTEKRL